MKGLMDWIGRWLPGGAKVRTYGHLVPDGSYTVVMPFTDYDGVRHSSGERWTFIRHDYLPYEDGLTLYLRAPDGRETQMRMQNRPEAQGAILDNFERYLAPDVCRDDVRM